MSEFKKIKSEKTEEEELKEEVFPSLFLDEKDLPEIDRFKLGKEYEMVLKVKPKAISKRKDGDKETSTIDFDIIEIKTDVPTEKEIEENSEGSYKVRD